MTRCSADADPEIGATGAGTVVAARSGATGFSRAAGAMAGTSGLTGAGAVTAALATTGSPLAVCDAGAGAPASAGTLSNFGFADGAAGAAAVVSVSGWVGGAVGAGLGTARAIAGVFTYSGNFKRMPAVIHSPFAPSFGFISTTSLRNWLTRTMSLPSSARPRAKICSPSRTVISPLCRAALTRSLLACAMQIELQAPTPSAIKNPAENRASRRVKPTF